MLENWTGEAVGLMRKYDISDSQLAAYLGVTPEYISMVLNGHQVPADIENRLRNAIKVLLVPAIQKRTKERLGAINKNTNDGKEVKQMAAKEFLSDDQVELEIERLTKSPLVALARREQRLRYKRRQYLYQLRDLEKKGRALEKAGITMDVLNGMLSGEEVPEDEV